MKTFLKESLIALEKKFPSISKSDLKHIWRTDPSGNNHWSKKIAQFYSEGFVGLNPILITIERYSNLTQRAKGARVQVKDINSFSTYSTFDNYVNQLEAQVKKRAERFKKKQAYEIVYEDSDWYVLYPEDFDTLATLGKDSDWCTAKRESTYNSYKKDGEFLIFIDKKLFKEYRKNSIPKEERNPDYKWLVYGKIIKIITVGKETLSLEQEELANLRNQHKNNSNIDKLLSNLDLKKILNLNKLKIITTYYNSKEELHREDGPAIEQINGDKFWYQNGKLSRKDGPAIEFANGDKEWYQNGELSREDGPAIEWANRDKQWYQNGELSREDGPAIEWANRDKEWYQNGKRHRKDGPAIVWNNGDKEWYQNGKWHREDGPAIEYISGTKYWYQNGKCHREDGPAIKRANGTKEWYLNNNEYSEKNWKAELIKRGLKVPK